MSSLESRLLRPEGDEREPRLLGGALAFLAGFAATLFALGRAYAEIPGVAFEPDSMRYKKLVRFDAVADDFDIAFVGTSRVLRGIAPQVFDARLEQRGHSLRSYNLGHQGMYFAEMIGFIDHVLELEPRRLRWLFVEIQSFDVEGLREQTKKGRYTRRQVDWHDPRNTRIAIDAILGTDWPLWEKLGFSLEQVRDCLHRHCQVGKGIAALTLSLGAGNEEPRPWLRTGFVPFELAELQSRLKRRHKLFLDDREGYEERWEALGEYEPPPLDERDLERLLALHRRAGEAGVEVVFLGIPPIWERDAELVDALVAEPGVLVLDFTNPDGFAEFYRPQRLFDLDHLNTDAATKLTSTIGSRFARILDRIGR